MIISFPDQSYLYFPPCRYVFTGAEVYKGNDPDLDDDCCSTPTDYSSDCDSPLIPPPTSSTDNNFEVKPESTEAGSSCEPEHTEEELKQSPNT